MLTADTETAVHHAHRHKTHRRRTPVCVNGKPVDNVCECELDYVGKHCEKKKHCESFRRFRNGSCPECLPNYTGEFCEEIVCVHGKKNKYGTECVCEDPYTGPFCDKLETNRIYSYYNRKVFILGPLGAVSLIPMCLLYMTCEHMARKRQVKRVGVMMEGQNINIRKQILEKLLEEI
ncbi:unnamed protein product [Caenorhabditis auriculariae]|uniref:EGF-like domain-containing protein n=1 Tax=Caenorhabditis auriculariae TaxID=2777116 RepID=A0A8S1GVW8_9PELO|nr:unnamed protein product [Caenorhabditis auriculariae]